MVRASWCVLTVGLLLLPVLHGAYSSADDDSFEVSDAVPGDAAAAANAPPPPPGRKKNPKKPKKSAPVKSAGIHVTYKNADGEDKDLDDELRLACNRGDLEEVRKMLDIRKEIAEAEGADQHPRDKYGNAPLHDVARRGLVEVAEVLIEEGGHNVNLQNGMADRALHMSAASGQLAMTELLVEHGAEIDPETSWGMTPLYWTANGGSAMHIQIAKFLLEKGADVNSTTTANYTMLHEAARVSKMMKVISGTRNCVSKTWNFALKMMNFAGRPRRAGIDGEARDGMGETAMHKAAAAGHVDVVRVLLESGMDEYATNQAGEPPIAAAQREGKDEIVEFFMSSGTKRRKPKPKAKTAKKKTKKKQEL